MTTSPLLTVSIVSFIIYLLGNVREGGGCTTWTGYFKCREVKTGFYRNRSMQTGSSGTLIGWKSGQTTFVPPWDRMEGAWLWTQGSDRVSEYMINSSRGSGRTEASTDIFRIWSVSFILNECLHFCTYTNLSTISSLLCSWFGIYKNLESLYCVCP